MFVLLLNSFYFSGRKPGQSRILTETPEKPEDAVTPIPPKPAKNPRFNRDAFDQDDEGTSSDSDNNAEFKSDTDDDLRFISTSSEAESDDDSGPCKETDANYLWICRLICS